MKKKLAQKTPKEPSVGNGTKPHVSGSAVGYVIAKCMLCKKRKRYNMDKPLNHTPMCDTCLMSPMIVQKVVC